jgi:hypothetical protein
MRRFKRILKNKLALAAGLSAAALPLLYDEFRNDCFREALLLALLYRFGGSSGQEGGGGGGGGGGDYIWYDSLAKDSIPPHAGAGAYGAQRTVQEAVAPTAPTSVGVTTFAEFESAVLAGGRTITINADIDGNGAGIEGNIADIDVIIPSGRLLRSFFLGGGSHTVNRVRFRGPTIGGYSGGQLHNLKIYGSTGSDLILDSIGCTGAGVVGSDHHGAILVQFTGVFSRGAIQHCRIMSGSEAYLGDISDLVVCGNNISCGASADPRPGPGAEAWGFRITNNSAGLHVFYENQIRGTRYSKIRAHPSGSDRYLWVDSNKFVDRVESSILWVDADAGGGNGDLAGLWMTNNETWATGGSAWWESANSIYVRFLNNTFHSDTFTSDANLIITGASDSDEDGNVYGGLTADPSWDGPGDPETLDWDIGV